MDPAAPPPAANADRPDQRLEGRGLACVRAERLVFAGLSFVLARGDALVLLGPNGSGKSSLLRMMAGLLRPAAGALYFGGAPVADDPDSYSAALRYVGHHDAIKPVLSVAENLTFWAGLHGLDAQAALASSLAALDRLGMARLAGVHGRLLSAGQRRRVNLARLLLVPSPIWLLDEPTTALDRASIAVLGGMLAEHRAGGGAVVLSTHAEFDMPGARVLHLSSFNPRPGDGEEFER